MLQPGRRVYCTRPGSRLSITVLARNTGSLPWLGPSAGSQALTAAPLSNGDGADAAQVAGQVRFEMTLLDAQQWAQPTATPAAVEADLAAGKLRASTVHGAEATGARPHKVEQVRSAMHALRLVGGTGAAGGACVLPGETGIFVASLLAPSGSTTPLPTGLHALRITPVSPCGAPLARALRVNIDVTCSDGIFCNGLEQVSTQGQALLLRVPRCCCCCC